MEPITEVRRSPMSEEAIQESVLEILDEPPHLNTQLFENSELADDPVVEAERRDPDRLFTLENRRTHDEPNLAILHETPQHRIIVYLKAQGLSNKEVAAKTGRTEPWISQLTRQPWFRLKLTQELKEQGVDQINAVLKSSALDSVFTLIDLRDDPTTPRAVRRSCADSLLDRFLGKAIQKITSDDSKLPRTSEIQAVEKELEEVNQQLKQHGTTDAKQTEEIKVT